MKNIVRLALFASILTGCTTTSKDFEVVRDLNKNEGLVYIFLRCTPNSNQWYTSQVGPYLI